MGANQSNGRISKDEKERRKDVQNHIIHQRKLEINTIESNFISQAQSGDVNVQDVKHVLQATAHAQNQLDRGGKPFNKGDLVAIIVALDNKRISDIDKLNNLRIEDLNGLIRCIIYDTKNFVPNSNNMLCNEKHNFNDSNKSYSDSLVLHNNVVPPLPPKPEIKNKNNMLKITYDVPPSYALVRR